MGSFNNLDGIMNAIKKKTEEVSGNIPINELLHDGFMVTHTKFGNAQEFFNAFPTKFKSQEEWNSVDDESKNKFVKDNTDFDTWNEMMKKAGSDYVKAKFKS